jgi:DNA-binding transcriptional LysR family regulator
VSGRLAITNLDTVLRACTRDLGIAHLPQEMCRGLVERGQLEEVLAQWKGPTHGLYLVYPSRQHLSPSVRAFIDFLTEHINASIMRVDKAYAWVMMMKGDHPCAGE